MPHATMPSPGLQALVLCGPGVSLNTFTANPKDLPKALIPIANRPMVWYAIDWCHRMGVTDITLIAPPESEPAIKSALNTHPELTSLPSPKPDILAPKDLEQTSGTAQILRMPEVQKCITQDFVVLPCDLVAEVDGQRVVREWMSLNPLSAGSGKLKGGLCLAYPTYGLETISHKKDETDFIATVAIDQPVVPPPQGSMRPEIERLVMSMPTDTLTDKYERDHDNLRLRRQLIQQHGRVKLKTKHRDAHVYIFPKWVKDYAARNEAFESISEDVVGEWAKAQWQKGLGDKLGLTSIPSQKKETKLRDQEEVLDPEALSSTKSTPAISTPFASRVGETVQSSMSVPPLLSYIQPTPTTPTPSASSPLLRRIDTPHALLTTSLHLAKQTTTPHPLAHTTQIHASATLGPQTRVAQEDCLVAENAKFGSRCVVKESVVGANCEIGSNVRMTRCLLMEGVVVGDGVTLTGCIVGRRARIEGVKPVQEQGGGEVTKETGKGKGKGRKADEEDDRTRLTDCEVAPNFVVEAGTEAKGEKMMAFDAGELDEFEDEEDEEEEEETGEEMDFAKD